MHLRAGLLHARHKKPDPVALRHLHRRWMDPAQVLHHPEEDQYLSKAFLYKNGAEGHENHVKSVFYKYLKGKGDPLVLDVGANIGTHSLWFAALGYRTHSFEPLKRNFALLHCSVTASPHVQALIRINNFGLGAKDGEACMESEERNYGGTHADVTKQCGEATKAFVRTLDNYWVNVLDKEQPFLLKADVEGFEPYVVEGAPRMFKEAPPKVMVMEYVPHFMQRVGYDHTKFLQMLHDYGYVLHDPYTPTGSTKLVKHAVGSTDLTLVHRSYLSALGAAPPPE